MRERNSPRAVLAQRAKFEEAFAVISGHIFSDRVGMWLWEAPAATFYVSDLFLRLMGQQGRSPMSYAEFWKNVVHPDDRHAFMRHVGKVSKNRDSGERFEFFYRVKIHGEYQWMMSKGFVLDRDSTGRATRIIGVVTDVRTLTELNEKFIVQTDRMAYALEATQGGLWDWSPDAGEVYYSSRYFTMMGYRPDSFPHTLEAWERRVHPDDLENIMRPQWACIESREGGDSFEVIYRFMAADGAYRWILSRGKVVKRDENGRGQRLVGLHIDVTNLRAEQEALAALVNCDPLTKVGSRFAFDAALAAIDERRQPVSLIYVDVDGLKIINDSMGHAAGDSLLTRAADMIRHEFRSRDLVARIGGDEFVVLLTRCASDAAERLMDGLRQACEKHNSNAGTMPILLSMGVAGTDQGLRVSELLEEADKAMLRDKAANARLSRNKLESWLARYSDRRIIGNGAPAAAPRMQPA